MSTEAKDYDETEAHPDRAMSSSAMNPSATSSTRMEYDRGDKMVETFFEHNKSRSRSLYDLMTLFMMQYGPTASVSGVLREVQAQRLLGFTEHSGGGHSSPVPQVTTPVAPAEESEEEPDVEQAPEPTPAPAKKKKPAPKAAATKTAAPKKTAPAPQPAPESVEEKEEATQSAPAPSAAAQALAADFFGDDEGDEVVTQAPVAGESDTEDTGTGTNTDTAPTDTDEDEEEEDFFASMRR